MTYEGFAEAMGQRIRKARKDKGLTIQATADITGVGERTIRRTENAEASLQAHTVFRIAVGLGVDPRELMPSVREVDRYSPVGGLDG